MKHIQYYSALAFALVAYVLLMLHSEYLYAFQDCSIFISGHTFMQEMLNRNQGLWIWVGSYLTQFFYYPWLGALLLVLVWTATYLGLSYTFKAKGWKSLITLVPVLFEVYAVMTFGYWLFYAKCPGYAFAMAICILSFTAIAAAIRFIYDLLHKGHNIVFNTIIAICGVVFVAANPIIKIYSWELPSKSFYSELKMYHAIDESRWDDVINENESSESPTNLMVLFKDIALTQSEKLGEWFKTNNCGTLYDAPESLNVRISNIAAPMIFFQFAQFNTAYRWAMENSVEYGLSVRNMKILARTALYNQEFDLALKYIYVLKATKFHRAWASEMERLVYSSTLLIHTEECKNLSQLVYEPKEDFYDGSSLCEEWIIDNYSSLENPTSKKLEMLALNFSLFAKDGYKFSMHFYDYVMNHPQDPMPHVFQEGAILFGSMEDQPLDISNYDFDEIVSTRYNEFINQFYNMKNQGLSDEEMGKRLRPLFGKTYWWHYYFYKDFTIY